MLIDRWMDKGDLVYTYSGILLSHKEEWNTDFHNVEWVKLTQMTIISTTVGKNILEEMQ